MSEKSKKKTKLECPVPKDVRETIKEAADTFEKHKEIVRKFNPLI
jgi:hypothetical protein